jgi:hypothetical protein
MQRKQQVGECWVCVIFFARVVVSECMCRAHRGVRGGGIPGPPSGGRDPRAEIRWQRPQKKKFCLGKRVMYLGGFFGTWFLPMVFYFRLRN